MIGIITILVSKTLIWELIGCIIIIIAGMFHKEKKGELRRIRDKRYG